MTCRTLAGIPASSSALCLRNSTKHPWLELRCRGRKWKRLGLAVALVFLPLWSATPAPPPTCPAPVPALGSPTFIATGTTGLSLSITALGATFPPGATIVLTAGAISMPLSTTVNSNGISVSATVPDSFTAQPGTFTAEVILAGCGIIIPITVTVGACSTTTGVSPNQVAQGVGDVALTVNGTNYRDGFVVVFQNQSTPTLFTFLDAFTQSSSKLLTKVPGALTINPAIFNVYAGDPNSTCDPLVNNPPTFTVVGQGTTPADPATYGFRKTSNKYYSDVQKVHVGGLNYFPNLHFDDRPWHTFPSDPRNDLWRGGDSNTYDNQPSWMNAWRVEPRTGYSGLIANAQWNVYGVQTPVQGLNADIVSRGQMAAYLIRGRFPAPSTPPWSFSGDKVSTGGMWLSGGTQTQLQSMMASRAIYILPYIEQNSLYKSTAEWDGAVHVIKEYVNPEPLWGGWTEWTEHLRRLQGGEVIGDDWYPVNTDTGNNLIHIPVAFKPTAGVPLYFGLTYNNLDPFNGTLGPGWTHNYNIRLSVNGNNATIKYGDGQVVPFASSDGINYTSSLAGNFDKLQKQTDGSFKLTLRNQLQYRFTSPTATPPLVLDSITDANGNTQTLAYDAQGELTSVTDSSSGRKLTFVYSGGHLVGADDPVQLGYDAGGHLTSITNAAGGVTRFTYDSANNLIQATDALGNMLSFTYDSSNRVISATDELGNKTTYAYGAGSTTITDPLGHVTTVVHIQHRLKSLADALGGVTSFTYDANNMIASVTNPLGKTWQFVHDANGNTTGATDPLGNNSTATYNSFNEPLTFTDALGHTVTDTYDSKGNLTKAVDPLGGTVTYTYESRGLPLTRTNQRGVTDQLTWDTSANLTSATDATGTTVATTTTYAYDALGRLTQVNDAVPSTTNYAYDALNRLTSVTEAVGTSLQRKTTYTYNADGDLTSTTDPRGLVTNYAYDAAGRLTSRVEAASLTEQRTTGYQYDASSNLTAVIDPRASKWQFAYDALNRLVQSTNPLGNQSSRTYDAAGNLTKVVDGNGGVNTFAYDAVNRLTARNYFDGKNVAYTYDAAGRRVGMTDFRGATSYTYDALGRLTGATNPDATSLAYSYDGVGNLLSRTYPDTKVEHLTYDELDRPVLSTDVNGATVQRAYDAGGRLSQITRSNGTTTRYTYDTLSRMLGETHLHATTVLSGQTNAYDLDDNALQSTSAAGGVTTNTYDGLNRLTASTSPSGSTTKYVWDASNNRTSVQTPSSVTNYVYDAANELVTAGSATLTYDKNGNLASDGTLAYSYDAADRLASASGGTVNSHYAYDGDGVRVSQQVPAGTYQYGIDLLTGEVLSEAGPDGNIDYSYTGASRDSEIGPAGQLSYLYDAFDNVMTVTGATGNLVENYRYSPWGQLLMVFDILGTKNKYKYGSDQTDPGTGLVYMGGGAYYNPKIGRFIGPTGADRAWNSYAYAGGNPFSRVTR